MLLNLGAFQLKFSAAIQKVIACVLLTFVYNIIKISNL